MIDLHMHSTCSDGMFSPAELMEKVAAAGVTAAALTDHDVVNGCADFKSAAKKYGIMAVNGSELAVDCPGVSMEILALDIPDNNLAAFKEHQVKMIEERRRVAAERLELLNKIGINLSWKDVAFDKDGNPRNQIGKPHIVEAMLKAGYIADWETGFAKYLNKGCPAYVAKREPAVKDMISFIRENGAVPVLAHPIHTKLHGRDLFELVSSLQKAGLTGIEVFHSDHTLDLRADYLQMIESLGMITAGGSDFHGGAHPGVSIGTGKGDLRIPELVLETLLERRMPSAAYYTDLQKFI